MPRHLSGLKDELFLHIFPYLQIRAYQANLFLYGLQIHRSIFPNKSLLQLEFELLVRTSVPQHPPVSQPEDIDIRCVFCNHAHSSHSRLPHYVMSKQQALGI
jgi:hypothetical protein